MRVRMWQQTLVDNGFERFRKRMRREVFLQEMDERIPDYLLLAPIKERQKGKNIGDSCNSLKRQSQRTFHREAFLHQSRHPGGRVRQNISTPVHLGSRKYPHQTLAN